MGLYVEFLVLAKVLGTIGPVHLPLDLMPAHNYQCQERLEAAKAQVSPLKFRPSNSYIDKINYFAKQAHKYGPVGVY